MSVAAGWFTDPGQSGRLRWWDGQQWTEHLRDAAPVPATPPAFGAPEAWPSSGTTAILPQLTPGRRAPASGSWQRPAVAAALAGVLAVGGFLGYRTLTSSSTSTSSTVASAVQAHAAPVDARKAATILDTFKPHDNTPGPGVTSTLIPKGDTLKSATLAGWCSTSSSTDRTRIARRQWTFVREGKQIGASVEVAAYPTSAQAKAAFEEFVAITRACTAKVVRAPKGTVTYRRLRVVDERFEQHISAKTAILQEDGVLTATKQKMRAWSTGTVLQRGQFLAIVWSGQQVAYTDGDLAVLRSLAQDTAHVLGTTPPG